MEKSVTEVFLYKNLFSAPPENWWPFHSKERVYSTLSVNPFSEKILYNYPLGDFDVAKRDNFKKSKSSLVIYSP
jgi:hypothetical protein